MGLNSRRNRIRSMRNRLTEVASETPRSTVTPILPVETGTEQDQPSAKRGRK